MNRAKGSPQDGKEAAPAWRTYTGRRIVVHAPEGSYAAKRAAGELREAERAADALQKLLEPPGGGKDAQVNIYLTDPVADMPLAVSSNGRYDMPGEAIVRVVRPEGDSEPLVWPVTHSLIPKWYGAEVAEARVIVSGIAGVVAGRIGAGPTIEEANDWVKAEIAEGRKLSVFSVGLHGDGQADGATSSASEDNRLATSFVSYLIETFGIGALRQFLSSYDPTRRDHASMTAYHRPLGTLEEGWLNEMRRRGGGSTAYRAFFRQILPLIKPYWRRQSEVFGYLLFSLVYGLAMPLASKFLIDTIIPSGSINDLFVFIGVIFGLYVINSLIAIRRAYVNSWMNQMILRGLQQRMFAHLQRLSHNFYGTAKVGDIITRISSDLQVVQGAMAAVVNTGIYMTVSAIAAGVAMMILSPLLGLMVLIVLPLFVFTYLALRTRLQKASYARQKIAGELTSVVQENLTAHAVVKSLGLEQRATQAFYARLMALFKAGLRLVMIGSLFGVSTDLAMTLGQVLVLGLGGYLVMQGDITIGTLLAFLAYLPYVFGPVGGLAGLGQTIQAALGSMERVNELIDEPVAVDDKPNATALPALSRAVKLENVTFSYGGDRPILTGLDLTIPAGANVSIVGPSGSGKSTIVNLLMRFWDPEDGRVLFDDHDLRDVTLASLRGQIGLVFQDTFVFDTSLRENIGLSKPDATDAEIEAAARAARLDSYAASLPAGFDTVLGERGTRMSGGQRQRLSIARALLRDPSVLILDEATSALDAQTEREILDTFSEVAKGRTTISITHRLSYAAKSDIIFVLEQGRLVEQGSHAQLIVAGGLYSRLYEEQTGYATATGARRVGVEEARLRSIPLFVNLGPQPLAAIADRLAIERYSAGEDVVKQGEAGDKMYIISRGQVDILLNDRRVNTLNEGDYFGEMALLTDEARTATVRTTMPTELYSLSQWDFTALLDREPGVRKAVEETVARRRAALAAASSGAVGMVGAGG